MVLGTQTTCLPVSLPPLGRCWLQSTRSVSGGPLLVYFLALDNVFNVRYEILITLGIHLFTMIIFLCVIAECEVPTIIKSNSLYLLLSIRK